MAGGGIERIVAGVDGSDQSAAPQRVPTRGRRLGAGAREFGLAGGKCQTGLAIGVHELLQRRLLSAALEAPMPGAIRRTGFAGAGEAAVQPTTTHYGSTHHLSSTGSAESGHGPHVAHGDER